MTAGLVDANLGVDVCECVVQVAFASTDTYPSLGLEGASGCHHLLLGYSRYSACMLYINNPIMHNSRWLLKEESTRNYESRISNHGKLLIMYRTV